MAAVRIWTSYGSEHSMNIVLIGKFKSIEDAQRTSELLKQLSETISNMSDRPSSRSAPEDIRFSEPLATLARQHELYIFGPDELEQFAYDHHADQEGDSIVVRTEEADFSAFIKLFIEAGARVEVFSAHDYPEDRSSKR